jgi:hypothetical protein
LQQYIREVERYNTIYGIEWRKSRKFRLC